MEESKLQQTTSRKHNIGKIHPDAVMVTPLEDLPSCIVLVVYYFDPRLFIYLYVYEREREREREIEAS